MRYSGASKQTGLTGRFEHLVSKPVAVYEAACEEFGDICRKSWLIGHRGVVAPLPERFELVAADARRIVQPRGSRLG